MIAASFAAVDCGVLSLNLGREKMAAVSFTGVGVGVWA